jgi:hypothetical protein
MTVRPYRGWSPGRDDEPCDRDLDVLLAPALGPVHDRQWPLVVRMGGMVGGRERIAEVRTVPAGVWPVTPRVRRRNMATAND